MGPWVSVSRSGDGTIWSDATKGKIRSKLNANTGAVLQMLNSTS
jgi:hypothetical protein